MELSGIELSKVAQSKVALCGVEGFMWYVPARSCCLSVYVESKKVKPKSSKRNGLEGAVSLCVLNLNK